MYVYVRAAFVAQVAARGDVKEVSFGLGGFQCCGYACFADEVCALVDKGQAACTAFGEGFGLGVGFYLVDGGVEVVSVFA